MRRPERLPSVGVVEACDDSQLFDFPLWPKQRELLAAVERGPRIHVWALGRRSAKTTSAALVGLHACLLSPALDAKVRPGERRYCVAVATNHRQARLFVDAARSIVKASPLLRRFLVGETEDQLVFANGAVLAAFPCSSRGGRGWPISTLLLDEAAHFVDESSGVHTAEKIWEALVPSTLQFGDLARVIVASTPYGQDGLFATLFQQAASGELADAMAHHATTAEANPTITAEFLEAERVRDPEAFRGEYLAEFLGSGAAFLDPERIDEALADRGELTPEMCTRWIAGLDPAFSSDPFGLAIVGRDLDGSGRLRLGWAGSWKPSRRKPDTFEERRELEDRVLDEVAAVCRRYAARVVTDQHCAPQIVDRLRRYGLSVEPLAMTATTKTLAFGELRARLYGHELELFDAPGLVAELRRLRTRHTIGAASVVNPRVGGSHGDIAQALALAVYEHDRYGIARGTPGVRRSGEPAIVRLDELDRMGLFGSRTNPDPSRRPKWYDRGDSIRTRVF